MTLTKIDLKVLKRLASEGRVIARIVGHDQAATVPEWTLNQFDLGRELVRLASKAQQ